MVCSFSFFVHPLSPAAKMYRIFRSSSLSFRMTSMIHWMSASLCMLESPFFFSVGFLAFFCAMCYPQHIPVCGWIQANFVIFCQNLFRYC